jgi:hypothetical protein
MREPPQFGFPPFDFFRDAVKVLYVLSLCAVIIACGVILTDYSRILGASAVVLGLTAMFAISSFYLKKWHRL